ncbi:cytochrome P450 [Longispora urticae]
MTRALKQTQARKIRVLSNLNQLRKQPREFFAAIGRQVPDGEIGELRLGPVRAVLLTDPDHVQRIFVTERDRYDRTGMMWKPMTRLNGTGLTGHGEPWKRNRSVMAPLFQRSRIEKLVEIMAVAIDEAVTELGGRAAAGEQLDGLREMTRIVHRALIRAFFGDRIALTDADRLGAAIATAFGALGTRMLMPFVPNSVRMPGDGRFMRAVREVDDVMFPLVRESMAGDSQGDDIVSWLIRDSQKLDEPLTEREIRDNIVTLFVGGTETTALALTWLWATLEAYPQEAGRLLTETRQAVGKDVPGLEHLPRLDYARRSLQEILRLFPGGWILPRATVTADVIDGVEIRPGDTVLTSPYLTHRMERLWPDAEVFDPERFTAAQVAGRHRMAYIPFGAGEHRCLGEHLYLMEGQLIIARLLRDFTPSVTNPDDLAPRAEITLRPRNRVDLRLTPRD